MVDLGTRLSERAAAGGGIGEIMNLVRKLFRDGREEDALTILRGAFNEKSYFLIRQFLLNKGFDVFFHTWKGREVFSMFGVPCDEFRGEDLKHTSYQLDFMWDKDRFKHSERNWQDEGDDCFFQENIVGLVKNSDRVVPSVPFYHWCISQIEKLSKNKHLRTGAMVEVIKVRELFISDFQKSINTSTRVFFNQGRIEHLWGQEGLGKFSVPVKWNGNSGYLYDLRESEDGRNVAKGIFGAWQPISDLNQMYNTLLDVRKGIYIYGNDYRTHEQAAGVLFRSAVFNALGLGLNTNGTGPVRLVSVRKLP